MVEPIDPSEGGYFQILHVTPRALATDKFVFAETVYGFSESIVVLVPDAADRWFDPGFGQTLGVANGRILPTAKRMMDQSAFLNRA